MNVNATCQDELFEQVGKKLEAKQYVNAGYLKGIKKREEEFPTGLITKNINIAIPHSDTEYIIRPFIYFVRLNEPVLFKQMGDNREMYVSNIFFLGIKNPKEQVNLLSNMMDLFMQDDFVHKFVQINNNEEFLGLIDEFA